jgi:hypothetical protein
MNEKMPIFYAKLVENLSLPIILFRDNFNKLRQECKDLYIKDWLKIVKEEMGLNYNIPEIIWKHELVLDFVDKLYELVGFDIGTIDKNVLNRILQRINASEQYLWPQCVEIIDKNHERAVREEEKVKEEGRRIARNNGMWRSFLGAYSGIGNYDADAVDKNYPPDDENYEIYMESRKYYDKVFEDPNHCLEDIIAPVFPKEWQELLDEFDCEGEMRKKYWDYNEISYSSSSDSESD